jgi:hypothetical protein
MSGLVRNTSTTSRWRTALRAGALAAALAVVAGVPLAAQAHDWDHRGWHGHHGWHHHPYGGYGYYGPRYYAPAPAYGYYAPGYYAPGYYYEPGLSLNFAFR